MSRFRETGELVPLGYTLYQKFCNNTESTQQLTHTTLKENGEYKWMSDVVVPNFFRKREDGQVFVNQMTSASEKWTNVNFNTFKYALKAGKTCVAGLERIKEADISYSLPSVPAHLTVSNLDSFLVEASTEAAGNVSSPDVEGIVELVELRKTAPLLSGPLKGLMRLRSSLLSSRDYRTFIRKSGLPDAPGSGAKFLASNWLKYRYGYLPLIRTADTILGGDLGRVQRRTARGTANHSSSDTIASNRTDVLWNTSISAARQLQLSCRAGVLYNDGTMYDPFGFRARDIPSAVWELVPYSFVVDWFTNASEYIRAITPKSGTHILGRWYGYELVTTNVNSYTATWNNHASYDELSSPSGSFTVVKTTKGRFRGLKAGLQISPFQVISDDFGRTRVLDALSLVAQLFTKEAARGYRT